jgi:WD40 repeat protein
MTALRGMLRAIREKSGDEGLASALVAPESGHLVKALLSDVERDGSDGETLAEEGDLAPRGMARVIAVWDRSLHRRLAMKVLEFDARTADPTTLRRFIDEARLSGQLDHPGIVPVHQFGRDTKGRLYFTMRHIEGRTLRDVFASHRQGDPMWSLARVVRVLQQACETVAYAHSRRLVHRDLKPSNIMVGRFGEVYVIDWGVARRDGSVTVDVDAAGMGPVTSSNELATEAGAVVGTPNYMPPEQAAGNQHPPSTRMDVYALGAVLYELLTGVVPYGAEPRQAPATTLHRVRSGPPTRIAEIAPNANEELVAVCEKAMARDPEQRYADAELLAVDLRAWLEGRVVRAHRQGAVAELVKWVQRNRVAATTIAVSLTIVLLGSTTFGLWTHSKNLLVRRARADAEHREYVANLVAAASELEDGNIIEARRRLESARRPNPTWEWRNLDARADSSEGVFFQGGSGVLGMSLSPSRDRVALGCEDGAIAILSLGDGSELQRFRTQASGVKELAWLPSGDRLLVVRIDGVVDLVTINGELFDSSPSAGTVVDGIPVQGLAVSDDGSLALVVQQHPMGVPVESPHRSFFEIRDDKLIRLPPSPSARANCAEFVPGTKLVIAEIERTPPKSVEDALGIIDPLQDCVVQGLGHQRERTFDLAIDPDGQRFALCSWDGAIEVRKLGNGALLWEQSTRRPTGRLEVTNALAFSPDGARLASGSWDRSLRIWDSATGQQLQRRWGHLDRISHIAFLDEVRVLSTSLDGTARIWRTDAAAGLGHADHPHWVTDVAFSPDGRLLATSCRDGVARVFGTEKLDVLHSIAASEVPKWSVAWSPDGRWLAVGESAYPNPSGPKAIELWNTASWRMPRALDGHDGGVLELSFSPTSTHLASASADGTVRIWALERGVDRVLFESKDRDRVTTVQYSPDGSRLLTTHYEERACRIWNVANGHCERTWRELRYLTRSARWRPDGKRVAVCAAEFDNTAKTEVVIWNVETGQIELRLDGHERGVQCLAWSPDGTRIATGSEDDTVRLWELERGDCVAILRDAQYWFSSLAWSPDGRTLAAGNADRRLRTWAVGESTQSK